MTTMHANGRAERKSLASQIDRLDTILDCLSDGLNEAVAMAVKEAVQTVLKEILTNEELRQHLLAGLGVGGTAAAADATPGANACRPGFFACLAKRVCSGTATVARSAWTWIATGLRRLCRGTVMATRHAGQQTVALASNAWTLLFAVACLTNEFRRPVVIAVVVGLVVGLGSYLAGPVVSALVCGVAGFTGSLAASTLNCIRHFLAAKPLQIA